MPTMTMSCAPRSRRRVTVKGGIEFADAREDRVCRRACAGAATSAFPANSTVAHGFQATRQRSSMNSSIPYICRTRQPVCIRSTGFSSKVRRSVEIARRVFIQAVIMRWQLRHGESQAADPLTPAVRAVMVARFQRDFAKGLPRSPKGRGWPSRPNPSQNAVVALGNDAFRQRPAVFADRGMPCQLESRDHAFRDGGRCSRK